MQSIQVRKQEQHIEIHGAARGLTKGEKAGPPNLGMSSPCYVPPAEHCTRGSSVPLADLVQVATVSKRPPCFPIVETSIGFHEVTKFMPNLFIGKTYS